MINHIYINKFIYNWLNIKNINYDNNILNDLTEENFYNHINFLKNNIDQIMYTDLYYNMYEECYELEKVKYIESDLYKEIFNNIELEDFTNILDDSIKLSLSIIFKFVIPRREYKKSFIRKNINNKNINLQCKFQIIKKRLAYLKNIKQPEQRTDEWYIFRNSTLTASNIWKIFYSEYSQNQLILEKCEPININKFKVTNLNSPLHWGQKYEPISTQYYEHINNTTVTEFGCIPHDKFPFLAASPDGIVCDEKSNLYGRMLEIKNVVSREITGIPKMEYWIQMQLQMEVCDLNECDFLETKFIEYLNYEEYNNDNTDKHKGFMLLYFNENNEPHYEYPPFNNYDFSSNEYISWYKNIEIKNSENKNIFNKYIYWKLEVISCILVLRNKLWFNNIFENINIFWKNLIDERESGKYKERIKNKRKLEIQDFKSKSDFPNPGCLIDLDNKEEKKHFIINVKTD